MNTTINSKIANVLFLLRIAVGLVLVMWTVDKFVNPVHAQDIYKGFFFMPTLGNALVLGIGISEAIVVTLFLIGRFKSVSYLIVLIMHTASTLAPVAIYLNPYQEAINLLFFAAWPMLAACITLYYLRDYDTKFTL